jgi:HAD superfamily hydrolase (TIGR01509 family)
MIQALIFDFDGLILDTELPEYRSWVETFAAYGASLPLSTWAEGIGVGAAETFDPYDLLVEQLGRPLDRDAIRSQRRARFAERMAGQPLLPGVEAYIRGARERGLKLGIASSSSRSWVVGHLEQLGIAAFFQSVTCTEDVALTKPAPDLYLACLKALGVEASQAIALEDSPNGVRAAKRAGLFCVAVPNALTGQLTFEGTDLQISSLAELPLEELLAQAEGGGGGTP